MIIKNISIQAMLHVINFDMKNAATILENIHLRNKPEKALWTSTWKEPIEEIGWIKWSIREDFSMPGHNTLYKVYPKKNLKIYEIDKLEDYLSSDLPKFLFLDYYLIDYKKLKEEGYDAVHFTDNGAYLGHNFNIDWNIMTVLNGIDCESTVWLNNHQIDHIEKIYNDVWEVI